MSLHIDLRPDNFEDVFGNDSLIKSLTAIFGRKKQDYPHAILLHGPTGCGKTTIARIIKNILKCSDDDFNEINASNTRGIDTAREILQTMHYSPASGESRVYLLDEVHQGTKDFQNSLLKALEDTPSKVYFILCTTDPEKLLPTIRNRCSSFEVERLDDVDMGDLLEYALDKKSADITDDVFDKIMDIADGCPRQALVTLDQIIDMHPDEQLEAVKNITFESKEVIELCRALVKWESWDKVKKIIKGLNEEPEKVRMAVLGYINAVALNGSSNAELLLIYESFREPFFYNKKSALTFACMELYI